MLPLPPLVSMPHGSASAAAEACIKSSPMAMISPSKRVALGHTSRCIAFMWLYIEYASPMNS
jgi:hypothetical protein